MFGKLVCLLIVTDLPIMCKISIMVFLNCHEFEDNAWCIDQYIVSSKLRVRSEENLSWGGGIGSTFCQNINRYSQESVILLFLFV